MVEEAGKQFDEQPLRPYTKMMGIEELIHAVANELEYKPGEKRPATEEIDEVQQPPAQENNQEEQKQSVNDSEYGEKHEDKKEQKIENKGGIFQIINEHPNEKEEKKAADDTCATKKLLIGAMLLPSGEALSTTTCFIKSKTGNLK